MLCTEITLFILKIKKYMKPTFTYTYKFSSRSESSEGSSNELPIDDFGEVVSKLKKKFGKHRTGGFVLASGSITFYLSGCALSDETKDELKKFLYPCSLSIIEPERIGKVQTKHA
jgi:hypothetical protein